MTNKLMRIDVNYNDNFSDNIKQIVTKYENCSGYYIIEKDNKIYVHFNICTNSDYNIYMITKLIPNIINEINNYKLSLQQKKIITFLNPPIDIGLKMYDKWIKYIAIKMYKNFPKLEYDDVIQLAYLGVCKTYNSIYLNIKILEQVIVHEILMYLRKNNIRNDLSLEANIIFDDESSTILGDIIPDEKSELYDENYLKNHSINYIYNLIISKLKTHWSERTISHFENAYRERGNTCELDRQLLVKIKKYLNKEGYTIKWYNENI